MRLLLCWTRTRGDRVASVEASRRVVTGIAKDGRSVVLADGTVDLERDIPDTGMAYATLWATGDRPISGDESSDPTVDLETRWPTAGETRLVILTLDPGAHDEMHATDTVDYAIVIDGSVTLHLTDAEPVRLSQGDVVVQCGAQHLWQNHSDAPATVAFVVIGAPLASET
jgi:quercetin dioxygenase-like cupin family protein